MAHKTKKKPARKQAKKAVKRMTRPASRKSKATRTKAAPKALKKKTAAVKARKAAKPARSKAPKKVLKKVLKKVRKTPTRSAKPKAKAPAPVAAKPAPIKPIKRMEAPPARLQRERRRLPEAEEEESFTEARDDSRMMSAARAGHDELRSEIRKHTASSPTMTAGDVDAKWQDAYALGDEAPGGDNMTPDQDRVDDIGKALGIEYADDEELLGGEELTERDEHRWELDPASKDEDEDL